MKGFDKTAQEAVVHSKVLLANTLNRLKATVKSFEPPLFHEGIADSFREAISLNPENSEAIYRLAMHLSDHNVAIKPVDLIETRYEAQMPEAVERSELVADLFRKVLMIEPNNIEVIIKLAACISNGVQIQKSDLARTVFRLHDPDKVDPNELEAELYRLVRGINPRCSDALYYLGMCFEERGVQIRASDLPRTKFEKTRPEKVPPNELAAEYYRAVIHLMPNYGPAYRHLAYCLNRGASIEAQDLEYLKIKGRLLQDSITRDQMMLGLYRKAISINSKDSVALYHLASFILRGAPIEPVDLEGTKWIRANFMGMNHIQIAASIYRKAIANNPTYRLAIRQLGICIAQGATREAEDEPYLNQYNSLIESKKLVSLALGLEKSDEPISQDALVGTCLVGQDPLKIRYPLIAEFYRAAIKLDAHSSEAILGLARCIEMYNVPVTEADSFGTEFEREEAVNKNDAAAELYRKAILINPSDSNAIIGLAICISNGADVKTRDLYGTRHIGRSPALIDKFELEAALYRRALIIDPCSDSALYYLANCIAEKHVQIEVRDLLGTRLEGYLPETVEPYELAALFYRKLMVSNPDWGKAARRLSICIERGASISPVDLVGTKLEGQPVHEVNIYQLIIALLVKAVCMNPKDQKSVEELSRFIPKDMTLEAFLATCKVPQKMYCPQFKSTPEKETAYLSIKNPDPNPVPILLPFPQKKSVLDQIPHFK